MAGGAGGTKEEEEDEEWDDERMKGVNKKLAKLILNEIMDKGWVFLLIESRV